MWGWSEARVRGSASCCCTPHPWLLPHAKLSTPGQLKGKLSPSQALTLMVFAEAELSLLLHNVVLLSTNYLETRR